MAIYHNGKNVKRFFGPRKINKVYSNNGLFFSSKLSKGTTILELNRAIGSISWASDKVMTSQNSYQLDLSKVENGITISFGKILSCDADSAFGKSTDFGDFSAIFTGSDTVQVNKRQLAGGKSVLLATAKTSWEPRNIYCRYNDGTIEFYSATGTAESGASVLNATLCSTMTGEASGIAGYHSFRVTYYATINGINAY